MSLHQRVTVVRVTVVIFNCQLFINKLNFYFIIWKSLVTGIICAPMRMTF